jgi:hypothetical protein
MPVQVQSSLVIGATPAQDKIAIKDPALNRSSGAPMNKRIDGQASNASLEKPAIGNHAGPGRYSCMMMLQLLRNERFRDDRRTALFSP